jgi:hypothetical protein
LHSWLCTVFGGFLLSPTSIKVLILGTVFILQLKYLWWLLL